MKESIPLLGMETEYGIIREDLEYSDPVEESMKLLKSCQTQMHQRKISISLDTFFL